MPSHDNTAKTKGGSKAPKASKVNTDGTKRIIKKGVQRPLRSKPMDLLLARSAEYMRRLEKHAKSCERIRAIHAKYQQEIDWKKREAGEDANAETGTELAPEGESVW